jgi:predicted metal-binding membrane protein
MTALARTGPRTGGTAAALLATLGLGAVAWVVALGQMDGMDMGYETELGSAAWFAGAWISMMAAMMLPGAAPATVRFVRTDGRLYAALLFIGTYLAVWTVVGVAVYAVYRPHGALAAGAVTVAAGLYELTPLKRTCRERCRERVRSGFELGVRCIGSSLGLMAMFVALGVMSIAWMSVIAAVVVVQKLLPARASVDVPLALAIVAAGVIVAA